MICELCLSAPADARLAGCPLCLPCVERVLFDGARVPAGRQSERCHGPVRGGRDDPRPVCRACVEAELERAMAAEQAPAWLREALPPLLEKWAPRRFRAPALEPAEAAEQLRELRRRFAEDGVIVPPERVRRHWLDDV